MGAKHERLGPRLLEEARSGHRARDVHVVLGGTGAVGGTVILELLSMYEEMFSVAEPGPDDVPVLVATGATPEEIGAFTRRMFRTVEAVHGPDRLPQRIRRGYLTASGVFVALERFAVTALPGLAEALQAPADGRDEAIGAYLHGIGAAPTDPPGRIFEALAGAVERARPF